ncbi:MAG: cytochrome c oxidase subunit II, partial [Gemmatimonadales bacterium]
IDFLYYVILWITGIAFVIVEIGLVWFLFKYRARPGRKARYYQGNNRAEVIWTAVPAVTVVVVGLMSAGTWNELKGRDSVPADALEYGVHAQQFEWYFTHAGPDGQLGSEDDIRIRNQLHIPVDQPVVMQLTAEEVIHSFFVPAFRIKQDAMPGMTINVWFEVTQTGEYELACAELCGIGHTRMRARVFVHTADDYREWLASRAADETEEDNSDGN